jgi:hypothetical protein
LSDQIVRCPVCLAEFSEDAVALDPECPACNTSVLPEYPALDVTVQINWDALRTLANWSLNWAKGRFEDPYHAAYQELEAIFKRLRTFRPADGEALTLDDALDEFESIMGVSIDGSPMEPAANDNVVVVKPKPKKLVLPN